MVAAANNGSGILAMTRHKLKDYPGISLELDDLDGKLDFVQIFDRSADVNVEIGCGKATFLLNEARSHPELNFLGLEQANKYYHHSIDRIGRWGLKNVRIIRADAASFLAERLNNACIACFHIYFPDPWPKRRHHKRRLFSHPNIEQMLRCLQPGGTIKIATDHSEYFEHIRQLIDTQRHRLRQIEFLPSAGAGPDERVGTNFERKYLREQRPIHTIAVEKI
jgi:tRNA (guanine-N7-)-methyltransferase